MTLPELRARRRENRSQMKTATGKTLALCEELDAVLNALIYKLSNRR